MKKSKLDDERIALCLDDIDDDEHSHEGEDYTLVTYQWFPEYQNYYKVSERKVDGNQKKKRKNK